MNMRLSVCALVCAMISGGVSAGDSSFARATALLDKRASTFQAEAQALLPSSVQAATGPSVAYSGRYRGQYLHLARKAAATHGIPGDLFARLVHTESGWNPRAVSPKGAIGLGQLMPQTARDLGVDPRDPRQNLDGAARYLRQQYESFRSWRLALAAYNAGPEAVRKYGGVPPYRETQDYVVAILGE